MVLWASRNDFHDQYHSYVFDSLAEPTDKDQSIKKEQNLCQINEGAHLSVWNASM